MTCNNPPELEAAVLLAHLDGEAEGQVADHIAACEHCRSRAQALRQSQAELRAALHRVDCPDPLQLAEHRAGLLPAQEEAVVQAHLELCPHCEQEQASLSEFQVEVAGDLKVSTENRIKVLIGKLISGGPSEPPHALRPALAGLRGGADSPKIYVAADYEITLSTRVDPDAPGKRTIYGLISGPEPGGGLVEVLRGADFVGRAPVDAHGHFSLAGLMPAEYSLTFKADDTEIYLPAFELD